MVLRLSSPPTTVEDFDQWILLPENLDTDYEFIAGEISEVVSNWDSAEIAATILTFVKLFALQHNLGKVTGADGGYRVGDNRLIPDVAFVRRERLTDAPLDQGYYPVAPDLAVEVVSPTDSEKKLRRKITNYLSVGVIVWVVDPAEGHVEIHASGQSVQIIGKDGALDGGNLLPGFTLLVNAFLS